MYAVLRKTLTNLKENSGYISSVMNKNLLKKMLIEKLPFSNFQVQSTQKSDNLPQPSQKKKHGQMYNSIKLAFSSRRIVIVHFNFRRSDSYD